MAKFPSCKQFFSRFCGWKKCVVLEKQLVGQFLMSSLKIDIFWSRNVMREVFRNAR